MNEKRTDFIKIRADILIDPSKHFLRDENGKMKWNMDSLDNFYDTDAIFRDPIITFINEAVGLHNWAIRFQPFFTGDYEAYIYCDNENDYHNIVTILMERLKGVTMRLYARRGTVEDYIADR